MSPHRLLRQQHVWKLELRVVLASTLVAQVHPPLVHQKSISVTTVIVSDIADVLGCNVTPTALALVLGVIHSERLSDKRVPC